MCHRNALEMVVIMCFCVSSQQVEAQVYADRIVDSSPLPGPDCIGCYPMPPGDVIFGPSDGVTTNFNDDGVDPGFVTVEFTGYILVDEPGPDINLWLIELEALESFEFFASQDCNNFDSLGIVDWLGPSGHDPFSIPFDLADGGLTWARCVKVVNWNLVQGPTQCCEGPDIDAFEGLHAQANPGIPAVSEWGMVAMVLLALTAGTLVLGRRGDSRT